MVKLFIWGMLFVQLSNGVKQQEETIKLKGYLFDQGYVIPFFIPTNETDEEMVLREDTIAFVLRRSYSYSLDNDKCATMELNPKGIKCKVQLSIEKEEYLRVVGSFVYKEYPANLRGSDNSKIILKVYTEPVNYSSYNIIYLE